MAARKAAPSWSRRALALGAVLSAIAVTADCGTVYGTPVDPKSLIGSPCTVALDCGAGRYCSSEGACTLECVTSADCVYYLPDVCDPNDLVCSPCGRCVAMGVIDTACLSVIDLACTSTSDCTSALGADFVCSSGECDHVCKTDTDCLSVGRGWGCGSAGLCVRTCFRQSDCNFDGWQYECVLPPGVDAVTNAESLDPVYGQCEVSPNGLGFPPSSPSDPPSAAYQGVWGWLVTSAVQVNGIPVLTSLDSVAVQLLLVKTTWQGPDLTFQMKWCSDVIQNYNEEDTPPVNLEQILLPDRNVDSIVVHAIEAANVPALVTGATFPAPSSGQLIDIRGAKLANDDTDPLPSYKDLTNQWDQDLDGEPGMTANATGLLSGDIYQAQRWRAVFQVVVFDQDHLGGVIPSSSDATTLGATDMTLINDAVTTQDPDQTRSYFHALRMADTASCNDVIAAGATMGGWLQFQPHYDPTATP
jgi:hypothetical protein